MKSATHGAMNDDCDEVNELSDSIHEYKRVDSMNEDDSAQYPFEYLNTLSPSGLPPHCLRLKVGCHTIAESECRRRVV